MARDRTAEAERARGERGERTQRARGRRKQANGAQADEDRKPTERVILKRERVLVLPDDVDVAALASGDGAAKLAQALGLKSGKVPTASVGVDAWVVVAEAVGSPRKAIEAHAGKPGTPEAKPGVYKAPTASGWKGGRQYEKPELPKVEARDID